MKNKIAEVQHSLKDQNLDGWLLYDFRKNNDLACQFLEIGPDKMLTRRFFYWIPQKGIPIKVVHGVERHILDHLPGESRVYGSWQELQELLKALLKGYKQIAMEYSPKNSIPTVSKVDAGTLEMIREFDVEVLSSADLIQQHLCVWAEDQLKTHLEAADFLSSVVDKTWELIAKKLKHHIPITEKEVQGFMQEEFNLHEFLSDDPPICAVNAHSADPHYSPGKNGPTEIRPGDFVLVDLWCKKKVPHAVYADISRVAVAASQPTVIQRTIFDTVKKARNAGTALIQSRFGQDQPLMGWEVDEKCREIITSAGYGPYFIHRTGHNIGESDHGMGANIDNYETQDRRLLIRGTCFSIEPGIYLPGKFGVRLEYDVYLPLQGNHIQITGGIQDEITCLF